MKLIAETIAVILIGTALTIAGAMVKTPAAQVDKVTTLNWNPTR